MVHTSLLLFGAHDNQSSRSPVSAILAIFLGICISLGSFQYGTYSARYLYFFHMRGTKTQPEVSAHETPVETQESENVVCAPVGPGVNQIALESSPKRAQERGSMEKPVSESAQPTSEKDYSIRIRQGSQSQHSCTANCCSSARWRAAGMTACLLIVSCLCISLSMLMFSRDLKDWASFWLAGLLAPVGALLRWHLGVLNSTPKSAQTHNFL